MFDSDDIQELWTSETQRVSNTPGIAFLQTQSDYNGFINDNF